ncbi:MAG: DNA primase [Proteobacteria bacterium]|nr:DNA primase [Pseudomonadota bacterium]
MIPNEKIDEIRARASIVQVVSEYMALKKQGSGYVGLCPFHSEKTPSFSVNEQKEIYYCFGCNEGGNVISFVMKKEGLSFPEAARKLGERYGVSIESEKSGVASFKDTLYKVNRLAATYFKETLYSSPGAVAREYLKGRGFSDKEFLDSFGVGYAPDGWDGLVKYLKGKSAAFDVIEAAEKAGLVAARKGGGGFYDRFRSRLIFPINDRSGRVIGFGGRSLGDEMPKYLNSPETVLFKKGTVLFGLSTAWESISKVSAAIVVEGYFDVLAMHRAGFTNTVASMGTAMTTGHVRALKGCGGPIYTLFDTDDAGKKAALRSLGVFLEEDVPCRMINLGFGKDPDEFLATKGPQAMKEAIIEAGTLMDFFFDELGRTNDMSTPEGKRAYFDSAVAQLGKIKNVAEQAHYVPRVANSLNLLPDAVYGALKGSAEGGGGRERAHREALFSPEERASKRSAGRAELTLLKVILKHPDLYSERVLAAIDEFGDPEMKQAGRIVAECLGAGSDTGGTIDCSALLERLEESKLKGWIAGAMIKEDDGFVVDPERMLNESISKILNVDSLKPTTLKMIEDLEGSGRHEEARQVRDRAKRAQMSKKR